MMRLALPLATSLVALGCVFGVSQDIREARNEIGAFKDYADKLETNIDTTSPLSFSSDPYISQAQPIALPGLSRQVSINVLGAFPHVIARALADQAGIVLKAHISGVVSSTDFTFAGTFAQAMKRLTEQNNWHWQASNSGVAIANFITRVYELPPAVGERAFYLGGSPAIAGEGDTDGKVASGDSVTVSGTANFWENLRNALTTYAESPAITSIFVSPAAGSIAITGRPNQVAEIGEFLEQLRDSLSRQVTVRVELISVAVSDRRGAGIDWAAVHKSASGTVVNLGNTSVAQDGTLPPVAVAGNSNIAGSIGRVGARRADQGRALLQALKEQGDVRVLTRSTMVAVQGEAASVKMLQDKSYLARTTLGAVGTGAGGAITTVSLEPGRIESGLSVQVIPRIMRSAGGYEVMLDVSVSLSTLEDLQQISSGSQSIQVPRIAASSFLHRARLNQGEPLVIAGIRRFESRKSSEFAGAGFDWDSQGTRAEAILVITPTDIR